ncbi:hypothetical protein CISIN_1g0186922mg, partial [Citrus sinensis]
SKVALHVETPKYLELPLTCLVELLN